MTYYWSLKYFACIIYTLKTLKEAIHFLTWGTLPVNFAIVSVPCNSQEARCLELRTVLFSCHGSDTFIIILHVKGRQSQ